MMAKSDPGGRQHDIDRLISLMRDHEIDRLQAIINGVPPRGQVTITWVGTIEDGDWHCEYKEASP